MIRLEPADMKGRLRAAFDRTAHLLPLHPALFAQHLAAFEAIRNERYENFMLYPCYVDGVPTTAIVVMQQIGNAMALSPLFIAPTDGMEIYGHAGQSTVDL
jgi:hypothetical protein